MEDFNSKYTGQQVEDLLDQVASGNAGGSGDGINEVYIADFTIESLRKGIYDGIDVECDIRALVEAMNANKVILVREAEDSSYQGVYVLNGYAEDLLYFSIVDTSGSILWCEGTDYKSLQYIDTHSLHERIWDSKQDALKSGENIKTINGESIVGSGNIEIGGGTSGGGGVETISLSGGFGTPLIIEEMLAEKRYWLYVVGGLDGNEESIVIGGFEGDGVVDGAHIRHFYAVIECVSNNEDVFNVSLSLPDVDICWSTGIPIPIRGDGRYELSITQVSESGYAYYNAVLTSFS